jgi:alkylresorcinol/alkylpyrone synthase
LRFINQIFAPDLGARVENSALLAQFEPIIHGLDASEEERGQVWDFVRFQLVGERSRRTLTADWTALTDFATRGRAFESGAEAALDRLAEEVGPAARAAGVRFDAVLTTTATGNLMPGLSYRLASRLPDLIPAEALMVDLGNVGCTGSLKALHLADRLTPAARNILVVAVEVPSTLADVYGPELDAWQGNCTFGDGAAALWVSDDADQGPGALALEQLAYRQRSDTGLNLIRWDYRRYYRFALADQRTFDQEVREHVAAALAETEAGWKDEPRWAIHPAGLVILTRIARRLGIPSEALHASVAHFREYSNMSSASIIHILAQVAAEAPVGAAVNMVTMGAGFNVIYGRVRRCR